MHTKPSLVAAALLFVTVAGLRAGASMQTSRMASGRALTDPTPLGVDLSRPVALKTLDSNAIDYVYIGAHPFPGPGSADWIDTAKLRASSFFRLVYERDGVEIFQFLKGSK